MSRCVSCLIMLFTILIRILFDSSKISCVSFCNEILEICALKANPDRGYNMVILGIFRPSGDGVLNLA